MTIFQINKFHEEIIGDATFANVTVVPDLLSMLTLLMEKGLILD